MCLCVVSLLWFLFFFEFTAGDIAGDDANKDNCVPSDTMMCQCTPTLCKKDEEVVNHVCIACDAGSTRAAGADASGDNNQVKCVQLGAPGNEGFKVTGTFSLSSLSLKDAKDSEDTFKKVIGLKFGVAKKLITIDSIAEAAARRRFRMLAGKAGKDIVVTYTIIGFEDQAKADKAKVKFEKDVKDGSFVTGLRSENNSRFTNVKGKYYCSCSCYYY